MPTGAYQTSVRCPFYKHDNGQKHRITCEGISEDSCMSLTFQARVNYKKHITAFCCANYKNCLVYGTLMKKYGENNW